MTTTEKLTSRDRVRERAYTLWEEAGCSEGQAYRFWHRMSRHLRPSREAESPNALPTNLQSRSRKHPAPEASNDL
jgi:hypothetical protein